MRLALRNSQFWFRCISLAIFCCTPIVAAGKSGSKPPTPRPLHVYRSLIPLGSEVFSFSSTKEQQEFYVIASATNAEFDGEQVWVDGDHHVLKTASGAPVKSYPREVSFRISVSERGGFLVVDSPFPVQSHANSFNDFISSLKFEMRIFHALRCRVLHPTKIAHIGIPLDVPANERVYRVTFDLGDVPISDRIVMHVLTPDGDRMAKFNFDLY